MLLLLVVFHQFLPLLRLQSSLFNYFVRLLVRWSFPRNLIICNNILKHTATVPTSYLLNRVQTLIVIIVIAMIEIRVVKGLSSQGAAAVRWPQRLSWVLLLCYSCIFGVVPRRPHHILGAIDWRVLHRGVVHGLSRGQVVLLLMVFCLSGGQMLTWFTLEHHERKGWVVVLQDYWRWVLLLAQLNMLGIPHISS